MTPDSKPVQQITVQPTLPDNSGYTWLYDSTDPRALSGIALGKTAAVRTVGTARGGAINKRLMLTVGCATQDVTLVRYQLTGAGIWALYASAVITAGAAPQELRWDVNAPDVLIGLLAGVAAPSAISTTLLVTEQP